jgi:uncharacterized protein (DUF58 family)
VSPAHRRLLVASVPVLAGLGIGLGQEAALSLAVVLALLLIEARAGARRRGAVLVASRSVGSSAFEDELVAVELWLENHGPRAATLVELGDSFEPGLADRQLVMEPGPLGPSRRRRLRYRASCSQRWGEYRVGPLSLTVADPMGLFPDTRVIAAVSPFAVLPRPVPIPGVERLGARPSLRLQHQAAARPGQSLAFLGVRDYRPGDERRRIHWPATARRGTPVVKELEVDRIPYFSLLLDLDRDHHGGTGRASTLDCVVRTAASLVWAAARGGHAVQIAGEDAHPLRLPPGTGTLHLSRCLLELIRVRQQGHFPFLDLVEASLPVLPPASTAALLCGASRLQPDRLEAALAALEGREVRPLVVLVHDASFTAIRRQRRARADADAHCGELTALLQSRGVAHAVLHSGGDLASALRQLAGESAA